MWNERTPAVIQAYVVLIIVVQHRLIELFTTALFNPSTTLGLDECVMSVPVLEIRAIIQEIGAASFKVHPAIVATDVGVFRRILFNRRCRCTPYAHDEKNQTKRTEHGPMASSYGSSS